MSDDKQAFLHSLHPLLPEDLVAIQSDELELEQVPCCHLLVDKSDKKRMIKLNQTGILIWGLCQDNRTVGEIIDLLSEAFEADRTDMARDVSRVVDHLIAERALINSNGLALPE
jgi:hypothetical protein